MRAISERTKRLIIEMYEENNAMNDIYKTLKVSHCIVYRVLKEAGVKPRGRGNGIRINKVKKQTESIKDKQPKQNTYTEAKLTFIDNICRGSGWAI